MNTTIPKSISRWICIFTGAMVFCTFCNNATKQDSFFYVGDQRIEIRIPGDTLGVLLRDSIMGFTDTKILSFDSARTLVEKALSQQGYQAVRYIDSNTRKILLVTGKQKNKTSLQLEDEARILANNNTNLISKAGYLVYIKKSNKPVIITDEIIIEFNPGTTPADISKIFSENGLRTIRQNPFVPLEYTVNVNDNAPSDALKVSQSLKNNSKIKFAQLNYFHPISFNNPPDYSNRQWSTENSGGTGSVDDADIDAEAAWGFTKGSQAIVIGIVDGGFDAAHTDLVPNLYRNPGETPGDGIDNDGNSLPDDINGWNFSNNNNNLSGGAHGTAVLGVAAADDNGFGITGSCPDCKYLLGTGLNFLAGPCSMAIDYFVRMKVRVINISWSYDGYPVPANVQNAIARATANDIVIICALSDSPGNYCQDIPGLSLYKDVATLPGVMGVSASTCKDMFDIVLSSGNCLCLLAPSGTEATSRGAFRVTTTDISGSGGYNSGTRDECVYSPVLDGGYTACFRGSSASAPLTAGVAGLVLSANPSLTAKQVQYLLQDCADKIEESLAKYSLSDAKSAQQTHGYGRLNAYEAVKLAAPANLGGRNGVDIFVRDNELDWGNTEKPSSYSFEPTRGDLPWWKSMDIKVDALQDETPATVDNIFFEGFADQSPEAGKANNVFVRVRNRGHRTVSSVTVNLYWVHAGAGLPQLPTDFWDRFPLTATAPSEWKFIGSATISDLKYSGPSVANSRDDAAQVVTFTFNAPMHDPSTRNHYCLMAIITSTEDKMPTDALRIDPERLNMDYVTTRFNNATHRNYNIVTTESAITSEFFMYNPLAGPLYSKLEVIFKGPKFPVDLPDSLKDKFILLKKNEKKLVRVSFDPRGLKEPAEVIIQQEMQEKKGRKIIGGLNYLFVPTSKKSKKSN